MEKKVFPRDKTCGDAIPGKGKRYLKELNLLDKVEAQNIGIITAVSMTSPKGDEVTLTLKPPGAKGDGKGYVCRREEFDNVIFQEMKRTMVVRN